VTVYATTLLKCGVSGYPCARRRDRVPRMSDVFFASLQIYLIDLPFAYQCQQSSASDLRVTPVRQALQQSAWNDTFDGTCLTHHLSIHRWPDRKRVASPC